MSDHIIFLFYLVVFLLSNIGYGFILVNLCKDNFKKYNFGYLGISGFFVIIVISYFTSYITPHNYIHNILLHIIGLSSFYYYYKKNIKDYKIEIKNLFLVFFIFIIGVYIFKNHDDFGYYHLTYSLNLSENKLMIGTGHFSHGFRTSSSIFYYHSTLYMPYIKYYLFHSGPFLVLIYFNYLILSKIINSYKIQNFDISYFFSILSFIYVNVVFYRIAEHGTDRSAQIIIFIIFLLLFELIFKKLNNNEKITKFNFILIFTFLAASLKVLFILYTILIPLAYFSKKFYKFYNFKKNLIVITICFSSFLFNITNSFLSTGCFVYPEKKTCIFEKYSWSLSKNEVERLSLHYEWWAKAGGGPGYEHEMKEDEYVKNFNWLSNWIDRHFFNKVSDTLFGTLFIGFITLLAFKAKKKKKFKPKKLYPIYLIILLLFFEWFLKHPSMRYGGYVLFALPIFIFVSSYLEKYYINSRKALISSASIILLTIAIYNFRNIARFDTEINNYYNGYQISKSPFFYLPEVKNKIIFNDNDFKIYKPIDNMCWSTPTPCSYRNSIKVINKNGFKVISRSIN